MEMPAQENITKISRTAEEAISWLEEMGIEVKPAIPSHLMYEFEYKDVLMLMPVDFYDDHIQLSCPFHLIDNDEKINKQTFEIVQGVVKDKLAGYYIGYVGDGLAYIDRIWELPQGHTLRKEQLVIMLGEISDAYDTVVTALALVETPIRIWESNGDNDKEHNDIDRND